MTTLRQAWARVLSFFRKQKLDRDFDREVAAHIELATDDYVGRGMTLAEARRLALIKLGGMEPIKEIHRDSRGLPWLDGVVQDVRFALRAFGRSPGFALIAVATLAIGIGVNTAVFRVADAVLFKGFPLVQGNGRLVYIANGYGCCVSWPDFEDWKAQAKSFEGMGVVQGVSVTLSEKGSFPERYYATQASADIFRLVGRSPLLGRDFLPSDATAGGAPVAILRYEFWERRFGKDPAIIGRTVRINGAPTTIIAVMPQGFSFPQNQDLWMPLVPTTESQQREKRSLWCAVGRLAEGVTIESARAEMRVIGKRLESSYPVTNRNQFPIVQTFNEFFIGPDATLIYGSLWGAVGFVLLIASANLANLLLARAIGRSREISIRMALGAGRWRIIRQLLIESMMLAAAGAMAGWLIANWGVRVYELVDRSWRILDYSVDYRIFGYVIAISIGTGLVFGLAPALRLAKLDVNSTLKDGGRSASAGGRGKHLSSFLVMAQIALAMVLLAGAGVMIRSFIKLTSNIGLNTSKILVMGLSLPSAKYPDAEAEIWFFDHLRTRLQAIPGVESVALADKLPRQRGTQLSFEFADAAPVDEQRRPTLFALVIGPDYFKTLGAPLLSGREFHDSDGISDTPIAIVNQRFASEHWPGENPLGKRLRLFKGKTAEQWLTVVGLVSNIVQPTSAERQDFDPLIYLPYREKPAGSMYVLARTRIPAGSLGAAFRHEVQALDSDLPIVNLLSLAEWFQFGDLDRSIVTAMFLIFAAIALLLASVGLYAVIAHAVSQRTQEIGIRMAVGATSRDVLNLVFKQGMVPLGIGLAVGLVASLAVNRVLKAQLVHVSPTDPITLLIASGTLILAAMLGCWIPARRAMRVDPVIALRHE